MKRWLVKFRTRRSRTCYAAVIRIASSSEPDVILDTTAGKTGASPGDVGDSVVGHVAHCGAEMRQRQVL